MKPFDLVIKGGEAVLPGCGRTFCDMAIHEGKIAAILASGEAVPAQEELPARGLVVMPGAVDVHLHLGHGKDIAARGNLWMPTGKRRRRQKAASPPLFLI